MPRDVGPIGPNNSANTPKMQTGVTSGYDRKGNGGNKKKGKDEEPEPEEDEEGEEEAHLDNDTFASRRKKVDAETFMNERMPWEVAEEERKRKLEEFNRKRAAMKDGRPRPHQPVKKDDRPAYEVRALGRQVEGGFDATSAVNSTLSAYNQLRERQQELSKDQNAPKPAASLDPGAVGQGVKFDPLSAPADRRPQPGRTDKFASWQSGDPASGAPAARPTTGPLQRPAAGAQRPAATPPARPATGPLNPPAGPSRPASPPKAEAPKAEAPARPAAERPRPVAPRPEPKVEAKPERPEPKVEPVVAEKVVPVQEPMKPEAPVETPVEAPVAEKVVPVAAAASMAAKGDFVCQYLIVDTFTGYGVPGARLEFEPISNDLLPVVHGTADTKGWYRNKDIAPGEYQLTVRYPGYIPEAITVRMVAGEMDEGQILLKRP